ncbi:porin family protein [Vibrio kasasachensis]|uniref:outer membrane protein n=1 Tax=Vibrio kasasachensis TaxID=2910248 RepID=UPI003D0E3E6F
MKILSQSLLVGISIFCLQPAANAKIHITPLLGFSGGGEVEDENGSALDIVPSVSFSIATELEFQTGRLGLYYSQQSSEVESLELDTTIQYLMFQSSIYYDLPNRAYAYLGVGIGGSYIDADWVDNHAGFAGSIFGGFEYPITQSISLTSQIRWLGTVVDNDTAAACNLPSGSSGDCIIRFKTDWMNQFTMGVGLVMTF